MEYDIINLNTDKINNLTKEALEEINSIIEYYDTTNGLNGYRDHVTRRSNGTKNNTMKLSIKGNTCNFDITINGNGEDIDEIIVDMF